MSVIERTCRRSRQPAQRRKSIFRCRGTSFTATRARWRGGSPAAGPFEAIVTVTRGGLVPAAIVARELGIRLIETVCVESYSHQTQGELRLLKTRLRPTSFASAAATARAC